MAVFCIRLPYLHSVEMAEPERAVELVQVGVVSTIQVDQQQEQTPTGLEEKIRKTERTQSTRADSETRPLLRSRPPRKRNSKRLTASTFGKLQP